MWRHAVAAEVRSSLSTILGTPVSLRDTPTSDAVSGGWVFAFELSFSGESCIVALDRDLARAIVDSLITSIGGPRGSGPISDAEYGVLEFVALECLDHVVRRLPIQAGSVTLTRFVPLSEVCGPSELSSLRMLVSVAASKGTAAVFGGFISPSDERLRALSWFEPVRDGVSATLSLASRLIPLSDAELAAVEPGDTLIIGASSLERMFDPGMIRTREGWELGPGRIIKSGLAHATVQVVAFAPRSINAQGAGSRDENLVRVHLGSLALSAHEIEGLRPGVELDFPMGEVAIVLESGRMMGTGELARSGEDLAVRVLSWSSAGGEP